MKIGAYHRYMLGVLMLVQANCAFDNATTGIVVQSIKHDLHLSDTQIGFLTGMAYAVFYAVMGIPIARWADRGNRVKVIAVTAAAWSVMVTLCGVAANYGQLLLCRVGVAVGEAGSLPPATSLISDHFPREERPRALGIYMLGMSFTACAGFFIAGWLNQLYGWRATYMLIGLPGLIPALLTWFTINEPRREAASALPAKAAEPGPNALEVFSTLWRKRTFRHLLLCFSVMYFFGNGIGMWEAAFFIRRYGLSTGELGMLFAVLLGLGGIVGTYGGGWLASRYAANNERLQLQVMAIVEIVFGVVMTLIFVAPSLTLSLVFLGVSGFLGALYAGPMYAAIQTLVPERMRATSVAIIQLFANFIGLGLGPLAAGAMSDALHAHYGQDSLRYALMAFAPGYLWCAWHMWGASRTIADEIEDPNAAHINAPLLAAEAVSAR